MGHFEYFRKFADIFASQDFADGVNYTDGKFATGINDTGAKFCHRYNWCCLIPVANNGNNIYLYVDSTTQRCPKYTFLIEDLSHLPPGSTTMVVHLELQYLPRAPAQLTPAAM